MKNRTARRAEHRARKLRRNLDAAMLRRMGVRPDTGNPKRLRPNPAVLIGEPVPVPGTTAMYHRKYAPSTDLWVCMHGIAAPDLCPDCRQPLDHPHRPGGSS